MQYLTEGDVLEFYREALGAPVLRYPEGLAGALSAPRQVNAAADDYGLLMLRAAALMQGLAHNRPFVTGNRRIAWISTKVFLQLHGFTLCAGDADVVDVLARGLRAPVTLDELADWIDHHSARFLAPGKRKRR